jgi:tetratricopeptide (TPR) repeat protein
MRDDERPPDIEPLLDRLRIDREDKRTARRKATSLKDVDSQEAAGKLHVNSLAILYGLGFGVFSAFGAVLIGRTPIFGFVAGFGITFGFFQFFARIVPNFLGNTSAALYAPSGSSTPAPPEYSLAQSLAVRGQFDAAMRTYEDAMQEHPDDPEPCICIARILRDSLERHDDAVTWLRRARTKSGITEGEDMMVSREIAELYMFTLRSPSKATPELARLAEKFPDTPAGEWARKNLREIKELMRTEESSD